MIGLSMNSAGVGSQSVAMATGTRALRRSRGAGVRAAAAQVSRRVRVGRGNVLAPRAAFEDGQMVTLHYVVSYHSTNALVAGENQTMSCHASNWV